MSEQTVIGSNEQWHAAVELIHRDPIRLTDCHLQIIGSTHPDIAKQPGRARAEALSKAALDEARQVNDAEDREAQRARALPPMATPQMLKGETMESWFTRNHKHLTPMWALEMVWKGLFNFMHQSNEKERVAERTARQTRVAGSGAGHACG